jgi:hypothetical protein
MKFPFSNLWGATQDPSHENDATPLKTLTLTIRKSVNALCFGGICRRRIDLQVFCGYELLVDDLSFF